MPRPGSNFLVLTTLLLVLLQGSAGAIPNSRLLKRADSHSVPLPPGDPDAGAPYSRCFAGEFTGDFDPDVVYLRGGWPALLVDPSHHQARVLLPQPAVDLARLPGEGPGGTDAIVLVNATDAAVLSYEPSGTFASRPLDPVFIGSTRILVADVDGSGTSDLVAVKSDGRTILVQLDPHETFPGPVLDPAFVAPAPILDLVVLDWSDELGGASALEIAITSEQGLEVVTWTGARVFHQPVIVTRAVMTSFRQPGHPFDRVAAIADLGGAQENDLLVVVDRDGFETALGLGPVFVVGVTAGDLDGDGDDDLFVRRETSEQIAVFFNQADPQDPTVRAFEGPTILVEFNVGLGTGPAPGTRTVPVVHDMDLDGDEDLVVLNRAEDSAILMRNQLRNRQRQIPQLTDQSTYRLPPGATFPELDLHLLPPVQSSPELNALEVVVLRQPHPDAPLEPLPTGHHHFPVSPWPGRFPVTLHDSQVYSSLVFYILYRMVERDATGTATLQVRPARLVSFSTLSRNIMRARWGPMFPADPLQLTGRVPDSTAGPGFTPPPTTPPTDDHGPPVIE